MPPREDAEYAPTTHACAPIAQQVARPGGLDERSSPVPRSASEILRASSRERRFSRARRARNAAKRHGARMARELR